MCGTALWSCKIVAIAAHSLLQLVLLVHHPDDDDPLVSKHVTVSIAKQGSSLSSPIRPCLLTS